MTEADDPAFDLVAITEAFERHGVAYIAIGGISGMLHGAVHYVTQDVDLMVRAVNENLERIVTALRDLGADSEISLADLRQNSQWHTTAGRVDILVTALGPNATEITFTDLTLGAELFEIAHGVLSTAPRYKCRVTFGRTCSAATIGRVSPP